MRLPGGSFRDPAGALHQVEGRVLRQVHPPGEPLARLYFESPALLRAREQGLLVEGWRLDPGDLPPPLREGAVPGGTWMEHPPVPFPTYPPEWTWSMLRDAASATLDLALGLLPEGLEPKDATPWNLLFRDTRPLFVDALSFEARPAARPYWKAYGQFLSTFLYPLLVHRERGLSLARAFAERRGFTPAECARLLGASAWTSSLAFRRVLLPHWLAKGNWRPSSLQISPEVANRSIGRLLANLREEIQGLPAPRAVSAWSGYGEALPYTLEGAQEKRAWVGDVLGRLGSPLEVLDLGANTGVFSVLACERGHRVVAVESDPGCADALFLQARAQALPVLPLVMNWGAPTPAAGWAGGEVRSFASRSRDRFDLVLALAFMHHLRFAEGVPIGAQIAQMAEHTRRHLILEWVGPGDPMVRSLAQAHGFMPADYTQETLESLLDGSFRVVERLGLPGGERWLYWMEKRA